LSHFLLNENTISKFVMLVKILKLRIIRFLILYYSCLPHFCERGCRPLILYLNLLNFLTNRLFYYFLIIFFVLLWNAFAFFLPTLLAYDACAIKQLLPAKSTIAEKRFCLEVCKLKFKVITIFNCIIAWLLKLIGLWKYLSSAFC